LSGVKLFTTVTYDNLVTVMKFEAENTRAFDVEVVLDLKVSHFSCICQLTTAKKNKKIGAIGPPKRLHAVHKARPLQRQNRHWARQERSRNRIVLEVAPGQQRTGRTTIINAKSYPCSAAGESPQAAIALRSRRVLG